MIKKLALCVIALAIGVVVLREWTHQRAAALIFDDVARVPQRRVAVVFGAGIFNNQPSPMLYDRIQAAVELYRAQKVSKLLMSGDNRLLGYNEPEVMRRTALQMGVPDADIALDYAGRSTYETCYRAGEIFDLQNVILVTQRYHLDRALVTCNALGVESVGFVADRREYRGMWWNYARETLATIKAVVEVFIAKPLPVLGEKIEIK